jgi:DHA1 family multidrug resistance protein-like MFS transporter
LLVFLPLSWNVGFIADIWPPVGRGPATSLFTASVFLGPVLGPIIEGFILQSGVSWRWIFWVMMIFAGVCTLLIIPTLPETYAPVILSKKARRLRRQDPDLNKDVYAEHEKGDWSVKGLLDRTLFRTFKMLALEPILVLTTIYVAIVYGLLYSRKNQPQSCLIRRD